MFNIQFSGGGFWILPIAAFLIVVLAVFLLTKMGAGTPVTLSTFQSVMKTHGYASSDRDWMVRLEAKLPPGVANILRPTSFAQALSIVNGEYDVFQYMLRSIGLGILGIAVGLGLDGLGFVVGSGGWIISPLFTIAIGIVIFMLQLTGVQSKAKNISKKANISILAIMPQLATVLSSSGSSSVNALRDLSDALDDPVLYNILNPTNLARIPGIKEDSPPVEQYRALGEFYNCKNFTALGDAINNARDSGLAESSVVSREANLIFRHNLVEEKRKAERNRTTSGIVTVALLFILLSIIGYPILVMFSQGL